MLCYSNLYGDEVLVDESDYIYSKVKITGLDKIMRKKVNS